MTLALPVAPAVGTTKIIGNKSWTWNGTQWVAQIPSGFVREILTAPRTYYVRADGSDANNGLANTAGGAFLTIQKAIDVISLTLDTNNFPVTIQVADGTYTTPIVCKPIVGNGTITIKGNNATPANVFINVAGTCITTSTGSGSLWNIADCKLQATANCINAADGNQISFSNIVFGTAGNHIVAAGGGRVVATGNYSVVGNAAIHIVISRNGHVNIANRTITFTGSISFSGAFIYGVSCGTLQAGGNTFTGTFTGTRYNLNTNSIIDTGTNNTTYFPGTAGGITSTGGQYA